MSLLSNSNFSWRDITTKKRSLKEKPKTVLFSGFLFAFLGVSGIQTSITGSFDTVKKPEASSVSLCQKQPGVEAIMSDSTLDTAKKDSENKKEQSEECKQEEKIKDTLVNELSLAESVQEEGPSAAEQKEEEAYQKKVAELETLLKGHPLAKMSSEIAKQEPEIAALIVGIARKESQWGLRSPKKNGDCFNYWGFKGNGGRGTGMGYACFATREEAIEKIASRLEKLVDKRGSSKPSALVTPWKCGNSCATHSKESVNKWVSDVNQYYTKVLAMN